MTEALSTELASSLQIAARLLIALLLGALVGVERQWRQRTAGLRTNALVSLGAASFTLFSTQVDGDASPTRVAAQVVSGVGFLGAGVMLKDGATVRGLNTAATLWCAAAVGVCAGAGQWLNAVLVTALILLTHVTLRPVARRINAGAVHDDSEIVRLYRTRLVCDEAQEARVRALLLQAIGPSLLVLRSLHSEHDGPDEVVVTADMISEQPADALVEQIVGRISLEPGIVSASWRSWRDDAL